MRLRAWSCRTEDDRGRAGSASGRPGGDIFEEYPQPSLAFSLHSHTLGSRHFPAAAGLEEEASHPFSCHTYKRYPFRSV
jgi:hypothetical protein